jgi:hypothetical protein
VAIEVASPEGAAGSSWRPRRAQRRRACAALYEGLEGTQQVEHRDALVRLDRKPVSFGGFAITLEVPLVQIPTAIVPHEQSLGSPMGREANPSQRGPRQK